MLFIAEIGMNHNGNYDLACELIKQAKYSGADIAKFQLGWRADKGEINCLDIDILNKLNRWCEYYQIELLFSIFTDSAFELAQGIDCRRYKIASRTVMENLDLVKKIISQGRETIISLGMWNKKDPPLEKAANIKYLWCKSKYPTEPIDLKEIPKNFTSSIYDGYSDHSIGIDIPLMAVSRGAEIIEKHFTLDKSDTTIRDHALSATPDEFLTMTRIGRNIYRNIKLGV